MKVISYTVGELPTVLEQKYFQGNGQVPISPLRAQAQHHNPRAEVSDKVLWCILSEDEVLVAYRLILPGTLYRGDTQMKMAWYSCLWVHPDHRGKGYGKQLTHLALEDWDNKIVFVNAAPASLSLYSNIKGCRVMYNNKGLRFYFTSELATLLPIKKPVFANFTFLLKPIDAVLNTFVGLSKKKGEVQVEYTLVDKLTDEDDAFIQGIDQRNFSRIRKTELDWLVDYPWVIESSADNPFTSRYHFSTQYPVYKNYFIKIEEAGETSAIVLLKNKEHHFTVHYLWAVDAALSNVALAILDIIRDKRPKTLSIYHAGLIAEMKKLNMGHLFKKDTTQLFMAYEGIPNWEDGQEDIFQYGDGDTVFT